MSKQLTEDQAHDLEITINRLRAVCLTEGINAAQLSRFLQYADERCIDMLAPSFDIDADQKREVEQERSLLNVISFVVNA